MVNNEIVLERKGDEVFCDGVKLHINPQASKNNGAGYPVVDISKVPGSNGQKWIALCKLEEGLNKIICEGRSVQKYELTEEEAAIIKEHQTIIDEIVAQAKERYAQVVHMKKQVAKKKLTDMGADELAAQIEYLNKVLAEKMAK